MHEQTRGKGGDARRKGEVLKPKQPLLVAETKAESRTHETTHLLQVGQLRGGQRGCARQGLPGQAGAQVHVGKAAYRTVKGGRAR